MTLHEGLTCLQVQLASLILLRISYGCTWYHPVNLLKFCKKTELCPSAFQMLFSKNRITCIHKGGEKLALAVRLPYHQLETHLNIIKYLIQVLKAELHGCFISLCYLQSFYLQVS